MRTIEEILKSLRRLPPDQRRRVRAELDALEQAPADTPAKHGADLLELAGVGNSEFTDVSSNKAKHLAEAYATKT